MPELENQVPQSKSKQIAAERREKFADKFRMYQDRANKKLAEKKSTCMSPIPISKSHHFCIVYALEDKNIIKLKTKPLNQIKDSLKMASKEFNLNYRGMDTSMRKYLDKDKDELKGCGEPSRKPVTAFKKFDK